MEEEEETHVPETAVENFKDMVKTWILVDDEIKKYNKVLTELRKKKRELTPDILDFMKSYDIEDCKTQDSKLKYAVSYRTKPINKDTLKQKLSIYLRSQNKGEEAADFILKNRDKTESVTLRRVMDRKKRVELS